LPEDGHEAFVTELVKALQAMQPQCMLNRSIFDNYHRSLKKMLGEKEVTLAYEPASGEQQSLDILPSAAITNAQAFLKNPLLQEEVFGPFTLLVTYSNGDELLNLSHALHGQLTASVFGEKHELPHYRNLLGELQKITGRLILNAVPTGVEVCHAMQHGGPYPATTDGRFTSVGTPAIRRFVRPVAFQGFPGELLPPALQDGNPLWIWRMVDGEFLK
jgi:NADP-dependent aldehyde dehydrogenase